MTVTFTQTAIVASTERQMVVKKVNRTVVNTSSAGTGVIQNVVDIFFVFTINLSAQEINYGVLDPNLIEALQQNENQVLNIYLMLEDQLDIDQLNTNLRAKSATVHTKAVTINKALRAKAKASQAEIISEIKDMDGVEANSIMPFWITNVIFVRCNRSALAKFSYDPRFEWIGIEGKLMLTEEESSAPSVPMPKTIQTGLEVINAPAMWAMGYTGYGQIALVADTGIDPTHTSYSDRYRGNTTTDSEAWFQGEFFDSETPFACGDHGTHVLGTILGLDKTTEDTIGVAFNAQWLGSPNLCFGTGTASNVATFQWAADPDDDPNTTEDMPDVINNSWRDPGLTGSDCNSIYVNLLNALEGVGVAVVFSAGNDGPEDRTITPPHNINTDVVNTFTVCALTGSDPNLPAADFSSRGPSRCGGEGSLLIKPEVSAPGVSVRSAVFENEYGRKSGTSMAAPHVSGAILLLKEAFPYLSGRDFKLALYNTCTDLGIEGEDNTFGMGVINVIAAYDYLISIGNEPVPPVPADDIVLLDIRTNKFECDGQITPEIVFYNDSPNVIETVKIQFEVDDDVTEATIFNWEGTLNPFESETLIVPGFDAEEGVHVLTAIILEANGAADARVLNNKIRKNVQVSNSAQVRVDTDETFSACQQSNMLLTSDYNGTGEVHWFDDEVKGNLLGIGNQISIQTTEESYLVYADIQRRKNTGELGVNSDIESVSNSNSRGIIIDAFHPFVIESYKIYSEDSGFIIVQLEAGNGDIIYSDLIRSDGSGWQTIEEPIIVQEARNMRLVLADGEAQLARNLSDTDYPYVVQDIMQISSSVVNGNAIFNQYHYFYDLEISYLDVCGRTAIEVSGVPTDSIPVADFVLENESASIDIADALSLTNASTNAVSRLWDFGDGNTSIEENPSHTYEDAGVYFVSLTVYNEDSCYDSKVVEVEVIPSGLNPVNTLKEEAIDFWVYPNPTKEILTLRSQKNFFDGIVSIYNNQGQLILETVVKDNNDQKINVANLNAGLYYLRASFDGNNVTKKFVKF